MKDEYRNKIRFKPLLQMLRPKQWMKNLLLLFPPFFAGKITDPSIVIHIIPAVAAFSMAASSSYIVNDIRDREEDRKHEKKKLRPLANSSMAVSTAMVIAIALFAVSVGVSLEISKRFAVYLVSYVLLSLSYTFILKHVVILDIFCIAAGFLLRVMAGGVVFSVAVSRWMFLTVFFVALFLAAGKRLGELILMGSNAGEHRQNLRVYPDSFLDGVLWFTASAALVTYALYVIDARNDIFFTIPLAAFGLLRYIYIVKKGNGDPTDALLTDKQIMLVGILWVIIIGYIIYP